MQARRRWTEVWDTALLFVFVLLAYACTLGAAPVPGESSAILAQELGGFPRMSPAHPLWRWLVALLGAVPLGPPVGRLNAFSAVCGAGLATLLYRLLREGLRAVAHEANGPHALPPWAPRVAGAVAALVTALSAPVWLAATRAGPALFDVLWLAAVMDRFLAWLRHARDRDLRWVALGCGAGLAEYAGFWLATPSLGLLGLYSLWDRARLTWRRVGGLVALFLLGFTLYGLEAWLFTGTEGADLRGYHSFWHVLAVWWREQALEVLRGLPRVGWLTTMLLTVVPCVALTAMLAGLLRRHPGFGDHLLGAMTAVVVLVVVANAPIAPWPLMGRRHGAVMPYVFNGLTAGGLVALFALLPQSWWTRRRVDDWRIVARRAVGGVLAAGWAVALLVLSFRNATAPDPRGAAAVARAVASVMDRIGDRRWLASDGMLDDHLRLAAALRRRPLTVVDLRQADNAVHRRYLARRLPDERLRNLADINLLTCLQTWLRENPAAAADMAVLGLPDLWMGAGLRPIPDGLVFLGQSDAPSRDEALARWRAHIAFVPVFEAAAPSPPTNAAPSAGAALVAYVRRQASLAANNLGVLLEDAGATDEARRAYADARRLGGDNISALMNLGILAERGALPETEAAAIRADLTAFAQTRKRKLDIWSLSRLHGYVRLPQAYAQMGWAWAHSGQPGLAMAGVRRAAELAGKADRPEVRRMLADVQLMQSEDDAGAELYAEALAGAPADARSILGLLAVALRRGDRARAAELFARAEELGVPRAALSVSRAMWLLAGGQATEARILLEEAVALRPRDTRAWAVLAATAWEQDDQDAADRALEALGKLPEGDVLAAALRADAAARRNDLRAQRRHLDQALARRPASIPLWERLLALDLREGRLDLAETHARRLLRLNPAHAQAAYVMGSLQLTRGAYDSAEAWLRQSVATRRAPAALNDLAWLLQLRGNYDAAETHAREALALAPEMFQAWDTLGVVLNRRQRHAEAIAALEKATALPGAGAGVALNLTRALADGGATDKARAMAESLWPRRGELSSDERVELTELRQTLRP